MVTLFEVSQFFEDILGGLNRFVYESVDKLNSAIIAKRLEASK